MTKPIKPPEVDLVAVLSTAHLSLFAVEEHIEDDASYPYLGTLGDGMLFGTGRHQFLNDKALTDDAYAQMLRDDHWPESIIDCLAWARRLGCDYLMFDRDGQVRGDLTTYDD